MIDIIIVVLIIVSLLCSICTYINIQNCLKKYKQISFKNGLSGFEVAEKILEYNGLDNMYIVETKNFLEEKYDMNRKVIRLLPDNFHGTSLYNSLMSSFLATHAIMDKNKNIMLYVRNILMFIMNIFVYLSYICIIVSSFMRNYGYLKIGIIVLVITILFHIMTSTLEKEASTIISKTIKELELIDKDDINEFDDLLNKLSYRYICLPITLITSLINYLKTR